MDLDLRCSKCRGKTWLEQYDRDIVQRCLCGLFRYLQQEVDGVTIMHKAVPQSEVTLPQLGTKIYRCLLAVSARFPNTIMTVEVARNAQLNNKETAALMVMLSARGLIERTEERRGLTGGSIWILSRPAAKLLKLYGSDEDGRLSTRI